MKIIHKMMYRTSGIGFMDRGRETPSRLDYEKQKLPPINIKKIQYLKFNISLQSENSLSRCVDETFAKIIGVTIASESPKIAADYQMHISAASRNSRALSLTLLCTLSRR